MAAPTSERLLLTVEEAAQRLGIGRTLAWRLVQERELPSVRVGRCVRVPLRDLEAWVEEQRQNKPR